MSMSAADASCQIAIDIERTKKFVLERCEPENIPVLVNLYAQAVVDRANRTSPNNKMDGELLLLLASVIELRLQQHLQVAK